MLEAVIALQLFLGEWLTASMIAALLLFNVLLGAFQESRANAALALLKQRLTLTSRVKRDGAWIDGPAANLVPGDIVQVSLGDVIPGDVLIVDGSLLLDQSMLTGESIPVETGVGKAAFAGGLVRRGGAIARVTATGMRTYFGRTAELVSVAHVESAEQKAVLGVVRNLTVINFIIAAGLVAYAFAIRDQRRADPFARPDGAAVGSARRAAGDIHPRRCIGREDAGDERRPAHATVVVERSGHGRRDLLRQDRHADPQRIGRERHPPGEAGLRRGGCSRLRRAGQLARRPGPDRFRHLDNGGKGERRAARADHDALHAVRSGDQNGRGDRGGRGSRDSRGQGRADGRRYTCADDADGREGSGRTHPRWISNDRGGRGAERGSGGDRAHRVQRPAARRFGGVADRAAFARRAPGHDHRRRGRHRGDRRSRDWAHRAGLSAGDVPERAGPEDFAVYAGIFPEQKFALVKAFQQQGHAVGMCGDGANDAPALRQAQMGIAVSTATDVAKAAAGVVLTEPGLGGIVACISEGRSAFQRVLTYTLTILINKCVTLIVLGSGLMITGHAVLTPLLQAISMLTNDFVTMARAADRARPSSYPNAWRVRNLTLAAVPLGSFRLLFLVAVLGVGWYGIRLNPGEMQTLTFTMLAFAGQGNVYVLREHSHLWSSRPAPITLLASFCDVALVASLAAGGVLMSRLPLSVIAVLAAATLVFTLAMDFIKLAVFARIQVD